MKRSLILVWILTGCGAAKHNGSGSGLLSGDGPGIVIAASDYRTGMLLGVNLKDGTRRSEVPIHSDAILRVAFGKHFVVNRLGQDNIQILSASGQTENQFSVGRGQNPQDIAVIDESTAYVSRFRSRTLLKVQLPEGKDLGDGVDFSSLADADGYPEMTWMRRDRDSLYVVVQRLDTAHGYVPTEVSYVGVVALASDTLAGKIRLSYVNPVTAIKRGPDGSLYVGSAGKLGAGSLDGGIERLNGTAFTSQSIATEAQLGGDVIDFEVLTADKAVAVVAVGATTRLVAFDPRTGKVEKTWVQSAGYDLQEVLWDGKTLWVGDRNVAGPSLRGFDGEGRETTTYSLSLPPYHLELSP